MPSARPLITPVDIADYCSDLSQPADDVLQAVAEATDGLGAAAGMRISHEVASFVSIAGA